LTGEQAGWLFVPRCSRQVPGPVESAWTPDVETIFHLELTFGPILQDALKGIPGRQANDYYRQYAGAVIGGERIVYVNGFLGGLLEAARRSPDVNRFTKVLEWRTTANVGICDGGANYFGAEYVSASDTIRNLRFDGALTIPKR
jgi:hypothetical protein